MPKKLFQSWLWQVSRPRFWGYLAGPWAIGFLVGLDQIYFYQNAFFWLGLLFFTWPSNFLVYAVNDWSDQDTDAHNDKKNLYETKYQRSYLLPLICGLIVVFVCFVPLFYFFPRAGRIVSLLWLFFSLGYSVLPIRFKARPILDSWSNILYILPGVMAFLYHQPLANLNLWIVLAATSWAAGMHLFSALPDIEADRQVGVQTTAVFLGLKSASWLACFYFIFSAVLLCFAGYIWLSIINFLVYGGIMIYVCIRSLDSARIFSLYQFFPLINTVMGTFLFWYLLFTLWLN